MTAPAAALPRSEAGGERPIRVLHIITRMIIGGAQENTLLSCALVDRRRFESEILCGPETGTEGSMHEDCARRGVPLHVEPHLVRRIDPWQDAQALAGLRRFLAHGRYDVVHTHTSKAGILGRVAARLAGVPVTVHTVHGWGFTRRAAWPVHLTNVGLERMCAPLADRLILVARNDRDLGRSLGIGRDDQYEVVRSGIEIERYRDPGLSRDEARERLGVRRPAFVIGMVGRLVPAKAPLDLFAAFVRVARERSEAHLVYVGDGPLRAPLEARIAAAGLGDRVHLLGMRRDVPEILAACDVLALTSLWEGLPRVFPQAMAAGLPIVATRVAGAPEAVIEGENGWLVDVGDMETFARRIIALAADPELAGRMGARGRERVEEFSARRMASDLEALYVRLLRARRA